MNRELKFRYYDATTTRIVYSSEWSVLSIFFEYVSKYAYKKMIHQYTGLQDKDGCEIYEGDILRIPFDVGGTLLGEITYRIDRAGYFFKWGADDKDCHLDKHIASIGTIIGTIYKNSNLLKNE